MTFGNVLLKLLEEREMTQKEFSTMLHIAPTTLNGYVKNKREPDVKMIKAIAAALHVSTDLLLGQNDSFSLSSKESLLIERLRRMDVSQQNIIFDLVMITDKRISRKIDH